jgi:hypothetical protein
VKKLITIISITICWSCSDSNHKETYIEKGEIQAENSGTISIFDSLESLQNLEASNDFRHLILFEKDSTINEELISRNKDAQALKDLNDEEYDLVYEYVESVPGSLLVKEEQCIKYIIGNKEAKSYYLPKLQNTLLMSHLLDICSPLSTSSYLNMNWSRDIPFGDTVRNGSWLVDYVKCFELVLYSKQYLYNGVVEVDDSLKFQNKKLIAKPYFDWVNRVSNLYPNSYRMLQIRALNKYWFKENLAVEREQLEKIGSRSSKYLLHYTKDAERLCFPPTL